ncbi:MAG: beta-hydroxyacyl-ACP dehydratase [Proteobacteria bacterium]|nr:beta-hydroxyacyl-ACP dehydratase [Pseudomonadota bacterium]NDF01443.1 beta-hydroxyacyl-ACP dehydratase [Verrucomicrobiota bacterium]
MNSPDPLAQALALLPHGPEFRFVDRLTALEPGVRGEGEYTVRGDEPFLRGHFPGDPMMPGVLLVEAVAQLAGVVAQSDPNLAPMPGLKLTALRGVKMLGTARTGETVCLRAELKARLGNLVQAAATATVGGSIVLQAEVTLAGTI